MEGVTETKLPTPTVTHPFQPGHTYSNKATPPNGATPWPKNIQTITFHSLAPIDLFKHMSLWGAILKHSIMQNAMVVWWHMPLIPALRRQRQADF